MQERDETQIQSYLDAMFEDTDDAHVETGSEILRQYGYTGAGIYFMGQKMGIQEGANAAILLFVVIVAGVFFFFYRVLQIQKKELEILRQENAKLLECCRNEEYILAQNKKIQNFIENIAHQMKTPLSRVFSSLDIVEDSLEDCKTRQQVEECYQHLDSINDLMRRLLDIGRLEAGKVVFKKELFDIRELLEELKEGFAAERERIQIDCEAQVYFYGDGKWLKEAVGNILVNALEADKSAGTVEISTVQGDDYIKLSIRDHGPGLLEKDIPNIFDRFYLPDNVKQNHTGIGLNLAKLIIEGHQGSLSVDNHFGGGAVFRIILPIYESLKVRG